MNASQSSYRIHRTRAFETALPWLRLVRLNNGTRRIMQTVEDHDHTTWWPLADYDCPWTRSRVHSLRWPTCQKPVFVSGKRRPTT